MIPSDVTGQIQPTDVGLSSYMRSLMKYRCTRLSFWPAENGQPPEDKSPIREKSEDVEVFVATTKVMLVLYQILCHL